MTWQLLPPHQRVCQICAVPHAEPEPHNRDSLYYQIRFYQQEERWPTWEDAIAHCPSDVQQAWRALLPQEDTPHA